MTGLRVERPRDGGGIFRRLVVLVDGREVARLGRNEAADVPLAPGPHTVTGRMDWTRSPELVLDLAPDEHVRVVVALPFSALWNTLLRPRNALSIRRI